MMQERASNSFKWEPAPKVIPFPLVRRRNLIRNSARTMARGGQYLGSSNPGATREKVLAATLKRQTNQLLKRGIDPLTITLQIRALELAIRCEYARFVAVGGTP